MDLLKLSICGFKCIIPLGKKGEAFLLGVHWILLYFIRISLLSTKIIFFQLIHNILPLISYPPGSKSEALRLGVHLILLYFIRISLLSAETFFYFGGSGWPTFRFFKSYEIYIYHINIKKFKELKSWTPPTTKIKKKVSALNSEILIKYKRIKWTPSRKASLLVPGG